MIGIAMRRRDDLARQPFTLVLGAGFFGFFAHTGILHGLEDSGLLPRRVVGVSAGALAGGLWCAGLSASEIAAELVALRRADFWDPALPLGGLLRGRKFAAKLAALLARTGVRRVEDCRVPFCAVAHDVLGGRTLPMRTGPLDVAIRASCTVPLMFRPLLHEGRVLVDGGVSDRGGRTAIAGDERVLVHWLPSRRRLRLGAPEAIPMLARDRGHVLVTPDLPSVSPFRLQHGGTALARARAHLQRWLDEPML
jgi:NTE family protein